MGPNDSRPSHTFEEPCLEKQETEFQPLTSISSRNVCRASELLLRLGRPGPRALLVAPPEGLGRFRPPLRTNPPLPPLFETVYSRNGTSKRDQRSRRSKETEYSYRSSSRTATNSLLSCWLVVSVEWRSYRLPWKESRARTPFSRSTTTTTTTSLASFSSSTLPPPPRFILQFPGLGYNLRYALNHLRFSLYGATLCT